MWQNATKDERLIRLSVTDRPSLVELNVAVRILSVPRKLPESVGLKFFIGILPVGSLQNYKIVGRMQAAVRKESESFSDFDGEGTEFKKMIVPLNGFSSVVQGRKIFFMGKR